MTVSTTVSRVVYSPSGSTTLFAVPFIFFGAEDIRVIERVIATGAESIKVLDTDYTVTGGGGATGTVTATQAPPATVQWVIRRATPKTQEIDYVENDPFPAATHEEGLDRSVLLVQDMQEEIDRSPKFPVSDPANSLGDLPNSVDRADKVQAFDANGKPIASTQTLAVIEAPGISATNAAASEANAAVSEANAAASEANAAISETNAAASAASIPALPAPTTEGRRIIADGVGWVADDTALGSRNLIINGDFRINQRAYVSAAALASGAYGHDRWKAGTGGGDYSFTQLAGSTTITIAAGKSLIQVIDAANVPGGDLVLSWTGTAQARLGVDSATPSGAYAPSPITITTQNASTVMSVEFDAGTLGKVQVEAGLVATPFEFRHESLERRLCEYYARPIEMDSNKIFALGVVNDTLNIDVVSYEFPAMRAAPTLTTSGTASDYKVTDYSGGGGAVCTAVPAIVGASKDRAMIRFAATAHGLTVAAPARHMGNTTGAILILESEL